MSNERIVSCVSQGNNIIVFIDGDSHVINSTTHLNYDEIVAAVQSEDWDTVAGLVDMKEAFQTYASQDGSINVEVRNNKVEVNGTELHNAIANRLYEMAQKKFPVTAFVEFMANVARNPSKRANEELFGMLEANTLPLTPSGTFLAYKSVKRHDGETFTDVHGREVRFNDLVDTYTGKIRNNPGDEVSMERKDVTDDKDVTCAEGLHFTSLGYATSFGGSSAPIVLVAINPANVVSIPTDYGNQKGRCCEYKVIKLHHEGNTLPEEAFTGPVSNLDYSGDDATKRWVCVSTNEKNDGAILKDFDKREDARAWAKQFTDVVVRDSWAKRLPATQASDNS